MLLSWNIAFSTAYGSKLSSDFTYISNDNKTTCLLVFLFCVFLIT